MPATAQYSLVPILVNGRLVLLRSTGDQTEREAFLASVEEERRDSVASRRMYYAGGQYDHDNLERRKELGLTKVTDRMPEHERKHAYSSQIQEAIDFIASELLDRFGLKFESQDIEDEIRGALAASPQFTGDGDDDVAAFDEVITDALVAGDVPCLVSFDPITEQVSVQAWESEAVEFRYRTLDELEKVIRTEIEFVIHDDGKERQVTARREWLVDVNELGQQECRLDLYWDDEEGVRATTWLGIPFIPWEMLVGDRRGLREPRGTSLIRDICLQHADRYNANEQLAYIVSRYNSHANIAVVGDAAVIQLRAEGGVGKDVNDVLAFPGGTDLEVLRLETDPAMIEHQKEVLRAAIFATFGLTMVEPDTIDNLGQVSGYALEILNRKTEGTFRRVRRNLTSSIKGLFSLIHKVGEYGRASAVSELVTDEDGAVRFVTRVPELDEADLEVVVEVTLGTGYIVDDVGIREDVGSGLISRQQGLRERGYDDKEIARIEQELAEQTALVNPNPFTVEGAGSITET